MSFDVLRGVLRVAPRADDPSGLVGVGGVLSAPALLAAVQQGWFPWTGRAPIPWCSPDPRAVWAPSSVRVTRSLQKAIRNRGFVVSFDTVFSDVVALCAEHPRPGQPEGTWLTPNLRATWQTLHQMGLYHSVEVWQNGELVGGLVGLALGSGFFGDTMVHRVRDASKVGFVVLCHALHRAGYTLVDGQAVTPHLLSLGAESISRAEYERRLAAALAPPAPRGPWTFGVPSLR